jgi:hypothetical protein
VSYLLACVIGAASGGGFAGSYFSSVIVGGAELAVSGRGTSEPGVSQTEDPLPWVR